MKLIDCTRAAQAAEILDIFNDAIVSSTALYDYQPRTAESMARWFDAKESGGFPVVGATDDHGALLGFASYGTFRAWPAYKYTVEHSIYVHRDHRGRGVGRSLLQALIERATMRQLHVLVGGVDVGNTASIRLHERLGFTHAGTIRQAGFKFGRWLDLAFYQRLLDTPHRPVDG